MVATVYFRTFWWRVEIGLRTGLATLLCTLVIVIKQTGSWMVAPFFAEVIAVIICDATLGRVLRNVWICLLATLTAVLMAIACREALGHSYAAMLCSLAGCSLVVAYPRVQLLGKKVALAQLAILMLQFHVSPTLGPKFALQLGGTSMLGAACAVTAMLLPFPQLAIFQVQRRAQLALRCCSALYRALGEAYERADEYAGDILHTHASMLAHAAAENIAVLREHVADLEWELWPKGRLVVLRSFMATMEALLLHCAGMSAALEGGRLRSVPFELLKFMSSPLNSMAVSSTGALTDILKSLDRMAPRINTENLKDQLEHSLLAFDSALTRAREVAYYHTAGKTGRNSGRDDKGLREASPSSGPRDLEENASARLSDTEEWPHGADSPPKSVALPPGASMVAAQAFLFSAERYVMEVRQLVERVALENQSKPSVFRILQQSRAESLQPSAYPCAGAAVPRTENDEEMEGADVLDGADSPIEVALPDGEAGMQRRNLWAALQEKIKQASMRGLKRIHVRAQLLPAMKVMVSLMAAAVIGNAFSSDFGFWAAVTVAFIIGGNQGGAFRTASLRLQGTVAGAVYGYLAIQVANHSQALVVLLLVPWVALTSFLRYSPRHGYSGIVAAFTAAIIMLGYRVSRQPVDKYALNRITETFVGVFCYVTVEAVVLPARAALLVRRLLAEWLHDSSTCVGAVVAASLDSSSTRRNTAAESRALLQARLRGSIARALLLVAEADMEPVLWRAPFPLALYQHLFSIQERVLRRLYLMDSALQAAELHSVQACTEQHGELFQPILLPLQSVAAEVVASLTNLSNVLSIKNFDRLEVRSTVRRWLCCLSASPDSSAYLNSDQPDPEHGIGGSPSSRDIFRGEGFMQAKFLPKELHKHPLVILQLQHSRQLGQAADPKSVEPGEGLVTLEQRYQDAIAGLVALKQASPQIAIVSNGVLLPFTALVFSMRSLLNAAAELESTVRDLLQVEQPLDLAKLPTWHGVERDDPSQASADQSIGGSRNQSGRSSLGLHSSPGQELKNLT